MEDYEVPAELRAELADLIDNWGKAYVVYVTQGGGADEWTAERRGGAGAPLRAASAWELRTKLRHDYQPERGTL